MRDIVDALGAKLSWSNASQSASVTYNDHKVVFTIDSAYVTIDNKKVKLSTPPAFLLKSGKETKPTCHWPPFRKPLACRSFIAAPFKPPSLTSNLSSQQGKDTIVAIILFIYNLSVIPSAAQPARGPAHQPVQRGDLRSYSLMQGSVVIRHFPVIRLQVT